MTKLDIIEDGYKKYPEQYIKTLSKDCIDINAQNRIDYINKRLIENEISPLIICDPKGIKLAAKLDKSKFPESTSEDDDVNIENNVGKPKIYDVRLSSIDDKNTKPLCLIT